MFFYRVYMTSFIRAKVSDGTPDLRTTKGIQLAAAALNSNVVWILCCKSFCNSLSYCVFCLCVSRRKYQLFQSFEYRMVTPSRLVVPNQRTNNRNQMGKACFRYICRLFCQFGCICFEPASYYYRLTSFSQVWIMNDAVMDAIQEQKMDVKNYSVPVREPAINVRLSD